MKKTFITLLTLVSSVQFILAQPTKADLDKTMKQLQERMKQNSGDTARLKALKNMQDQQQKMMDAMKSQPANNKTVANGSTYADPGEYSNVDNWKFPAKNTALLSSLPKRVFTKPELLSFLSAVYEQLSKKLPAGISSSVQSIAAKYNNDGDKMGDAAVTGWYTNYREEALLLIIKAASNNPGNGTLLNNCAAILNMGGIEQTAIPILKYLLQVYPNSSMVLNNLGQAYAGLGETDTAMVYLGRCIKAEPENPEANNTAGQIEASKGNTEKAISYFEQSLKGAYNKPAELKLRKLKNGSNIVPFVRPRVKLPDYFNQFKYKFPAQCTSTNNAAVADAAYRAFQTTVGGQLKNYSSKIAQLQQKLSQNPLPNLVLKKDGFAAQPFYEFCEIMLEELWKDFIDNNPLKQYEKKFSADYANIENEYLNKLKLLQEGFAKKEDECCGVGKSGCCPTTEEKCKAYDALANQYLPKYAMLTEDWQEKCLNHYKRLFDELMYWGYLVRHPSGDDYFRVGCSYYLTASYLEMLGTVGKTKIIEPCDFVPMTATCDISEIKEMECPIDIEVPFIVGSFSMNCDKISLSGGEGALFSYEKNFKTKKSTFSVGIGAKIWGVKKEFGPIKGSAGAGLSESLFITFDGNNKIVDAGLKFSATISGGLEAEAEARSVKATKEIYKDGTSIGYTAHFIGINSGWDFNEGPFKGMIGPAPEVQVNKNVNIYKPNN